MLLILALQILNMSLNNAGGHPAYNTPASHTIHNRVDCAFEFITENLMGWENFIPENGAQSNHQANHLHKSLSVCWYLEPARVELPYLKHEAVKDYPVTLCGLAAGFIRDITPPPPRPGVC